MFEIAMFWHRKDQTGVVIPAVCSLAKHETGPGNGHKDPGSYIHCIFGTFWNP